MFTGHYVRTSIVHRNLLMGVVLPGVVGLIQSALLLCRSLLGLVGTTNYRTDMPKLTVSMVLRY